MAETTKPDKRQVRAYMARRTHAEPDDPPPMPDDIRRELGWELIPHNDDTNEQP